MFPLLRLCFNCMRAMWRPGGYPPTADAHALVPGTRCGLESPDTSHAPACALGHGARQPAPAADMGSTQLPRHQATIHTDSSMKFHAHCGISMC